MKALTGGGEFRHTPLSGGEGRGGIFVPLNSVIGEGERGNRNHHLVVRQSLTQEGKKRVVKSARQPRKGGKKVFFKAILLPSGREEGRCLVPPERALHRGFLFVEAERRGGERGERKGPSFQPSEAYAYLQGG